MFDAVFVLNYTQALCLKMMQALGMKKPGQCCVEWVDHENDRRLKEAATTLAALAAQEENYPAYRAGGA